MVIVLKLENHGFTRIIKLMPGIWFCILAAFIGLVKKNLSSGSVTMEALIQFAHLQRLDIEILYVTIVAIIWTAT